jgi:DNA replication protein DnaC
MTNPDPHAALREHLAELRLAQIAEIYPEVLNEAARKNCSPLDVLATLVAAEITARRERALQRRIAAARLPKRKTLEEFDMAFPKRIPKQKVLRLFDCEFVAQHQSAVIIGPTGIGKTHLLTALGYTACERGVSVRFTRVVDMLNGLTAAQINGTLAKALKVYTTPSLLLLDELGYLPIDKRGADLMFQVAKIFGSYQELATEPCQPWALPSPVICQTDLRLPGQQSPRCNRQAATPKRTGRVVSS